MTPYKTGAPVYLQAGWPGVHPAASEEEDSAAHWLHRMERQRPQPEDDRDVVQRDHRRLPSRIQHRHPHARRCRRHRRRPLRQQARRQPPSATRPAELGPLPATYITTSRNDGVSGIRMFRVEPGLRWPTGPGKDIEFVHKGHRYAIVRPSIHTRPATSTSGYDHAGNGSPNHQKPTSWPSFPTNGKSGSSLEKAPTNLNTHRPLRTN